MTTMEQNMRKGLGVQGCKVPIVSIKKYTAILFEGKM